MGVPLSEMIDYSKYSAPLGLLIEPLRAQRTRSYTLHGHKLRLYVDIGSAIPWHRPPGQVCEQGHYIRGFLAILACFAVKKTLSEFPDTILMPE